MLNSPKPPVPPPPETEVRRDTPTSWRSTRAPRIEQRSAQRRVEEYLRALGLVDPLRSEELSQRLVQECAARSGSVRAETAVAHAQARVQAFAKSLFGENANRVEPLWMRAFLQTHPEAFLAEEAHARTVAAAFGDPLQGAPPVRRRFEQQRFASLHFPRWMSGLWAPALLTGAVVAALAHGTSYERGGWLAVVFTALFAGLYLNASIGFFTMLRGFILGFAEREHVTAKGAHDLPCAELPRSVVLVPIYHEDAEHVFAAVAAMQESLANTPGGASLELFVLSDSRRPECIAEEERAWRRVAGSLSPIPVFYRRRARNHHQKAGNLAEFFERWGHRYSYAVVLDADSLVSGATLVEMVRRIHANPRLGLLQAPLALHRGETFFARAQQFASSLAGPLATRGLSDWADAQANYYGHNAVLRVRAFLGCCALPILQGRPPLGGPILSHDFVEAALLCRAGWEVRMADDLSESWEELPPTLPEFVTRDRRWCQGNLQHLKIAASAGLMPMSRVHMLVGAAAYLAAPAWLALVAVGVRMAERSQQPIIATPVAVGVTAAVACVLVVPRLLGLLDGWRASQRAKHGGALAVTVSALIELGLSACVAPLLMVHHTRIVLSIALGQTTRWGPQSRRATAPWRAVLRSELPATLLGGALLSWLLLGESGLLWALSPLWVPLLCAIPIAMLASSRSAGLALRRLGLLLVPSEVDPHPLSQRVDDLRVLTAGDEASRYRDLVLDPLLVHAQLERLQAEPRLRTVGGDDVTRWRDKVLRGGPAVLTGEQWRALVHDPDSLRWLHAEAWRHWPVETWELARERPQLPPDRDSVLPGSVPPPLGNHAAPPLDAHG